MPAAGQRDPTTMLSQPAEQTAFQTFYARTERAAFSLALRITGVATAAETVCELAYADCFATDSLNDELAFLQRVRSQALMLRGASSSSVVRSLSEEPSYTEVNAIRAGLEQLGPLGKRALELAYFGGLGVSDIAGLLDEPVPVVRTALREALIQLGTLVRSGEENRP